MEPGTEILKDKKNKMLGKREEVAGVSRILTILESAEAFIKMSCFLRPLNRYWVLTFKHIFIFKLLQKP